VVAVDGLAMGPASFQNVLSFGEWPCIKLVIIVSWSLTPEDITDRLSEKVRLSPQEPETLMQCSTKKTGRKPTLLVESECDFFIRAGLIFDITLTPVPILIGEGLPLFGSIDHDIDLEHLSTDSFASGLVNSKYQII